MDTCVIIPTFWTTRTGGFTDRILNVYTHPTHVDECGTLPKALESLERVCGACKVVVTVATNEPRIEAMAEERVTDIAADFPGLDALVFGTAEQSSLHRRMEQLELADMIPGTSLFGYGAIRNVGLIAAAVLGSEAVVFLDDDQIVTDPDYIARALYGLGRNTKDGTPILAKTGYYVDENGKYHVDDPAHWYDMFWRQVDAYNNALAIVDAPPRLRKSTIAFGGCLALHRDMFCNVSFDPWIPRGEDIDYVINVMMHGGDVFLDGEWSVVHKPPPVSSKALGFRQDVYRFIYEHRKLEFAKSQVDLRQVSARRLMPYPGEFVGSSVSRRAVMTGLMRAAAGKEPNMNMKVARSVRREVPAYAQKHCQDYFEFQRRWPIMMERLWDDVALKSLFLGERRVDRSAITGRFPALQDE
jgi:hypothetical protein